MHILILICIFQDEEEVKEAAKKKEKEKKAEEEKKEKEEKEKKEPEATFEILQNPARVMRQQVLKTTFEKVQLLICGFLL